MGPDVSAEEEIHARLSALYARAAVRADALAVRVSVLLSKTVLAGLLLLPFCQPGTFYIVRVGHLTTPPEVELHARVVIPPSAPSIPASPGSSSDHVSLSEADDKRGPTIAASNAPGSNVPATSAPGATVPALPAEKEAPAKPVPPAQQTAPQWTQDEVAAAKKDCESLLAKMAVDSEELPPAREGICGAPAPRLLKSVGDSKVRIEPAATLNCKMIAGMNSWILDKLQPAAKKNFGSPIVRVVAESYSCRNRYGLARAPISEHALMNAVDVSAFVLADGKIIRVSKNWGPTAEELKKSQKSSDAGGDKAKFQVAASKLGAHDIAKKSDDQDKADDKAKGDDKHKSDEKVKARSPEAIKEEQAKQAMSAFLHEAHDGACDLFGTVLGPDTNEAHHDHFHLDMKERKQHRALCE
ncbi:extensin family protein [Hyphomicrobium sp.]|uniref:extensin-like domain-containing protein n=1 Tax=Hyphomicrobium sp. TaxID=82 RepID=UPI0025BB35AF|nr:extensin family protein [Hyphomicrobium sp.]